MDKELLRMVIIIMGIAVFAGLLIWSFMASKNRNRKINFYDDRDALDNIDESLIIKTGDDDFEIVPLGSVNEHESTLDIVASDHQHADKKLTDDSSEADLQTLPAILQFRLSAKPGTQFLGADLADVFAKLGLEYGSLKVFERLDEARNVDYAVANMIEPGFFPNASLEAFTSPGIVFFMQPKEVNDVAVVFDDLINTMQLIAEHLGGEIRDLHREILTPHSIRILREKLTQ
jgi:cell division protein ZipA